MKTPFVALVVSSPRLEPLLNPAVEVPSALIVSMSVAVNSPVPPTLKAAVAPDATTSFAAVMVPMLGTLARFSNCRVPALTVVVFE